MEFDRSTHRRFEYLERFRYFAYSRTGSKRIAEMMIGEYERGMNDAERLIATGKNHIAYEDALLSAYSRQILSTFNESEKTLHRLYDAYRRGVYDGREHIFG